MVLNSSHLEGEAKRRGGVDPVGMGDNDTSVPVNVKLIIYQYTSVGGTNR